MTAIKAIIIDDEKHSIGSLEILLKEYVPSVRLVGSALEPANGIAMIAELQPDLVFLDIAMPDMNGFELLDSLDERNFEVIFTTAYNEYTLHAIRVSAVDYLLKPVDVQELIRAVERVRARIDKYQNTLSKPVKDWEKLLATIPRETHTATIALPTFEGIEMIPVPDIIYVEADGNYAKLVMEHAESLLVSKTLKDMDELLGRYDFLRVHHSYLVRINRVRRYVRGDGGSVIMDNGDELSVSRSRKEDLLRALRGQ